MKKRFIPATVAALALTFSAVAVPQAVAVEGQAVAEDTDVTIEQGDTVPYTFGSLFEDIGATAPADHSSINSVTFTKGEGGEPVEWLSPNYTGANRLLTADEDAPAGSHELWVTVTWGEGEDETVSGPVTVTIEDTTPPVITAPEPQPAEVGTAIEPIDIVVSEAATVTVDGLPAGLEYDADAGSEGVSGAIVGTPTEATPTDDPANVTVNATDAAGNPAAEVTFEFTVGPDVTDPVIENPGSKRFVVNEAIVPIEIEINETATVSVEGLPVGLSFDSEGLVISGTPTVSGNPVTVTIRAVDEAGNSSTETFTATVVEADDNGRSSIGSAEGSSADDINWGLVGVGGVLAALIGVIAAIGGGFIQLPPAIANLIPFL